MCGGVMIEWSQVDALEAEMGESFPEVVALFLEEAGEIVERLEGGDRQDGKALAADLHALKGAALNLGLTGLADLCAEGERSAEAGQYEQVALPETISCFRESCAALDARLRRGAA